MSFIPYLQRKAHVELKPADFVRIQGDFFIIDEVRKFRRPFPIVTETWAGTRQEDLTELTGNLKSRFQHIDKFAIEAAEVTSTVEVIYRGADITGLQYGHLWTNYNANVGSPTELGINSFGKEDIIRVNITTVLVVSTVRLWFSGEEYTLVGFPKEGGVIDPETGKGSGIPERFVIVAPYGFSRVITYKEFTRSQMATKLRS